MKIELGDIVGTSLAANGKDVYSYEVIEVLDNGNVFVKSLSDGRVYYNSGKIGHPTGTFVKMIGKAIKKEISYDI